MGRTLTGSQYSALNIDDWTSLCHPLRYAYERSYAIQAPHLLVEGRVTVRIHEADGTTPYEHGLNIFISFQALWSPFQHEVQAYPMRMQH
jgi:hypothetical protein